MSVAEIIEGLPVYRRLELTVPGFGGSAYVVVHVVGGVRISRSCLHQKQSRNPSSIAFFNKKHAQTSALFLPACDTPGPSLGKVNYGCWRDHSSSTSEKKTFPLPHEEFI